MQVYVPTAGQPAVTTDWPLSERIADIGKQLPYGMRFGSSRVWGDDLYTAVVISAIFTQMIRHASGKVASPCYGAPYVDVIAECYEILGTQYNPSKVTERVHVPLMKALSKLREANRISLCNAGRKLRVTLSEGLLMELLHIAEEHLAVGNYQ